MSAPRPFPPPHTGDLAVTDAQVERLAVLLEEMGKAAQVVGKVLRHGYAARHPDGGMNNRELLERELGDVLCAVDLLQGALDVRGMEVQAARQDKHQRITKYLHHQPPR